MKYELSIWASNLGRNISLTLKSYLILLNIIIVITEQIFFLLKKQRNVGYREFFFCVMVVDVCCGVPQGWREGQSQ